MSTPLVSVLMVNYNHEKHLGNTIESVLSQTYTNIQFIIVDDGSTDSSPEIIRKYEEMDARIESYIRPRNQHISHATNFGFDKVKGEYLARIDSDDFWYPEKLEKQLLFMEQNPGCRICSSWTDVVDEYGNNINDCENSLYPLYRTHTQSQEDWLRFFFYYGNCICHCGILMETSLMREVGYFNLVYRQAHDFDYWVRVSMRCQIYIVEEHLLAIRRFIHSEVRNTSSRDEDDMTRYFNEYTMIRSHFFDEMSDDLFISTFGSMFRRTDSSSPEELECEKAFLLCDTRHPATPIPVLGLLMLEKLMTDKRYVQLLEDKYDFTPIDYYKLNEQHLYNDTILNKQQRMAEQLQNENQSLKQALEELHRQLSATQSSLDETTHQLQKLLNSTCWKITKPIRYILDKLHA